MILGVDEVGRGPWAGPLVVGAVVLAENIELAGLTDSKKLTAKKRTELDVLIRDSALGWGLGWVQAEELDTIGLSAALRLATIRAVEAVTCSYHEIIIDGTINFLQETAKGQFVTTLPKADAIIPAVSAASIIAKVARDKYMAEQALVYPEYGFEAHVGYGTAKHSNALATYGVTPLHRKSFKPIAAMIKQIRDNPEQLQQADANSSSRKTKTTKQLGDQFEDRVAEYLLHNEYTVLARNWRTKYCEIDIVASLNGRTYFVEAKYRSSHQQGGGLEAIDSKKLAQIRRAANAYIATHSLSGDCVLVAAVNAGSVSNPAIELIQITDE